MSTLTNTGIAFAAADSACVAEDHLGLSWSGLGMCPVTPRHLTKGRYPARPRFSA